VHKRSRFQIPIDFLATVNNRSYQLRVSKSMVEFLKKVFRENYIVDNREPKAIFEIPHVDGRFALYGPCLEPWKQLIVLGLLQSAIQIVLACFIYKFIVQRRGTIESYMFGWGFVIPFSLYIPFPLLDFFDIRYATLLFVLKERVNFKK
ncbi:MAG: hypothetical protein ACI8RD_013016, partial [Bacillariaceae sp.]|jgi:hypothetical protein